MWKINLLNVCVFLEVIGVHHVCSLDYLTEKPEFLQPCSIHQPDLTECLTKNKQRLVALLTSGSPEADWLGSIDPIRVPIEEFRSKDLNVTLRNIKLFGFKNTVIEEERFNSADFSKHTKMFLPHARLEANYELKGILQQMPLSGAGDMFMEIDDLYMELEITTLPYEKGGFTFLNVTHVDVEMDATHVRSHFDNLSTCNPKNLEESISLNGIFNKNWKDFFQATRPFMKQILERVLLTIDQRIFNFIPANFLIEDIPTCEKLHN